MIFQRVRHGAQCRGGTAGCETMGTTTGKGNVERCTDVTNTLKRLSRVDSPACKQRGSFMI